MHCSSLMSTTLIQPLAWNLTLLSNHHPQVHDHSVNPLYPPWLMYIYLSPLLSLKVSSLTNRQRMLTLYEINGCECMVVSRQWQLSNDWWELSPSTSHLTLWEHLPKGCPQQKSLQFFLSKHTLLICSSPRSIHLIHLFLYSILPSYKWPFSSIESQDFTHAFFSKTLHSSSSHYGQSTSIYFFSPSLPLINPVAYVPVPHLSYTLIALTISLCYSTFPYKETCFHRMHPWLLYFIPHPRLWSTHQCQQKDIIP